MTIMDRSNLKIIMSIMKDIAIEKKCAIALKQNGVTEEDFISMKDKLDLSNPILLKVQNYLRDEWKNK